jgi:hypothetical protein
VANLFEGLMDDTTATFNHNPDDPMNGMTRANLSASLPDDQKGVVFEYGPTGDSFMEFELPPGARDLTPYAYLSLRACQATRHPMTTAELGDLSFSVTLRDGASASSTIDIAAYGGGIEEPYQRTGCGGTGAGWQNEFEVIRIRLEDFLGDASGLDLADVAAVRFDFGASFGSAGGRLGFDDIILTRE